MISYELYSQIRLLHQERGLNFAQIARELNLDEETVAKGLVQRITPKLARGSRAKASSSPTKSSFNAG